MTAGRRTALGLLLLAAPALAGAVPAQGGKPGPAAPDPADVRSVRASQAPFVEPVAVRSAVGALKTTLTFGFREGSVGPQRVRLLSYNGQPTGPTLRVRPGDRLLIRLENGLDPSQVLGPRHGQDVNQPHELEVTNLHTHGLHVSPTGSADNVFREVRPGDHGDFEINVPRNHPAGTFWYHPHKHGSVAFQVSGGAAGALLVEGGIDDVAGIKGARERVFVFQQIPFRPAAGQVAEVHPEDVYPALAPKDRVKVTPATTINGQLLPVLELAPGEVQRWRLVHAGLAETLKLSLQKLTPQGPDAKDRLRWYEVAVDGLTTGTLRQRDAVLLHPGYRRDVLVKAEGEGEYVLMDEATGPQESTNNAAEARKFVARVVVRGAARPMALPREEDLARHRAAEPVADREVQGRPRRTLRFGVAGGYLINGAPFDPNRVGQKPVLGTAEEWELVSDGDNHPFHIHVNPFFVVTGRDKGGAPQGVWRDTVMIQAGATVVVRLRFPDFTGKTVLHCHNLKHEDQGMMQAVEIVPAADPKAPPAGKAPAKSARGVGKLPRPAPAWRLAGADGTPRKLSDFAGHGLVLVFVRGLRCSRCAAQLQAFAQSEAAFREAGLAVLAVSPDPPAELRKAAAAPGLPPVLSDAYLGAFRHYGCLEDGVPLHGTFVIDGRGLVRWQHVGDEPFADVGRLLGDVRALVAR
jgi:FtsP/CotA-like multicopper oxidase with cupredoxin domain/peroxiredoxin